jgi:hypothetical protein
MFSLNLHLVVNLQTAQKKRPIQILKQDSTSTPGYVMYSIIHETGHLQFIGSFGYYIWNLLIYASAQDCWSQLQSNLSK